MSQINTKALYKFYMKNGGILEYSLFKKIIDDFHKTIVERCLEGETFAAPSSVGVFKIFKRKRIFKIKEDGKLQATVNWGESKKRKKELEEKGVLLYKPIYDDLGNIVGDNGGEKWIVYKTNKWVYFWQRIANIYLSNGMRFHFKPSFHNERLVNKTLNEDNDWKIQTFEKNNGKSNFNYLKQINSK